MKDGPTSLAAHRVDKTGNSKLWTVEDMLVETLDNLRNNELGKATKAFVIIEEEVAEDHTRQHIRYAGVDRLQSLGLISIALIHMGRGDT